MERVILAITLHGRFTQTRPVVLEVLPLRSTIPLEDFVRFEHRNCFFSLGDQQSRLACVGMLSNVRCQRKLPFSKERNDICEEQLDSPARGRSRYMHCLRSSVDPLSFEPRYGSRAVESIADSS